MRARNRWRWALAVAGAALLGVAASVHLSDRNALRARFLMASPDGIAQDGVLRQYALARAPAAFAAHCASCHGKDLRGDPKRGVANLMDADWLYGSGRVSEIERTILYGIRSGHPKAWNLASMPAFATPEPYKAYKIEPLTPGELADVTAYVLSLSGPAADATAVQRGSVVFHKNGFCFDCHGADGRGDPAIGAPDLTDRIWLYGDGSMASVSRSIAHGLAGACPPWIDRLAPETIRAIAVYIHLSAEAAVKAPDDAPAAAGTAGE